jgi:ABC-type spermidine/putrescine transport system permease subunit II
VEELMGMRSSTSRLWPVWVLIVVVLALLYAPTLPVIALSFTDMQGNLSIGGYAELLRTDIVIKALRTTAVVGVAVAVLASILGLLAAISIRELGIPRLILLCMLLPLFIPGVSMGLASALLFKIMGISPSLVTIIIVQTLWALPFATLIILTVMATFDPAYLEAAYVAGASRLQAFRDIEFPLIAPGIFGAASFSFIISINETIRTSAVQGPWNTVPTYIWSSYKQVGLSPVLYALMGVIILSTFALAIAYLLLTVRRKPTA